MFPNLILNRFVNISFLSFQNICAPPGLMLFEQRKELHLSAISYYQKKELGSISQYQTLAYHFKQAGMYSQAVGMWGVKLVKNMVAWRDVMWSMILLCGIYFFFADFFFSWLFVTDNYLHIGSYYLIHNNNKEAVTSLLEASECLAKDTYVLCCVGGNLWQDWHLRILFFFFFVVLAHLLRTV